MTWEPLVIPVLLVLALLVQLLRAIKGTVEEAQGGEPEAIASPVAITKEAPIRESRGPGAEPHNKRPAMERFPTVRRRRPRIAADVQAMRRGIVLMAVLGPCRGLEPPDGLNSAP